MLASVFRPSFLLVRRTDSGLKYALSKTMTVVPGRNFGLGAAHHAGHRHRALASAMTSMSGDSARDWPSSVVIDSPRAAVRTRIWAPASSCKVERVHRLAQFEQHVVGDVDDVADRSDAGRLQARLHPRRRRADGHVGDRACVARAEVRVLDARRRCPPSSTARQRRSSRCGDPSARRDRSSLLDSGHGSADRMRSRPRAPCPSPTCSRAGWP